MVNFSFRYNHRIYYTVQKILKSMENITEKQVAEISGRKFTDIMLNVSTVGDLIYEGFHGMY